MAPLSCVTVAKMYGSFEPGRHVGAATQRAPEPVQSWTRANGKGAPAMSEREVGARDSRAPVAINLAARRAIRAGCA